MLCRFVHLSRDAGPAHGVIADQSVRAQGTLKVEQLSLLDAIEDNPHLPEAFKELRELPRPAEKPLREDKARAQARATKDGTS
ncbi:hypothetical protein [Streptomyces sp. NBC_00893]|uniref:hypothetical protein n=1 Tax=Streptomyces sp. NBC_00893 TaxID=2975862 RepID=UPI0022512154|nr:hypothetical protein [Streptomyces sp. NBC_00893]MCX4852066.1 hypothetical protein [Streptomyces sp. NBC_00893]